MARWGVIAFIACCVTFALAVFFSRPVDAQASTWGAIYSTFAPVVAVVTPTSATGNSTVTGSVSTNTVVPSATGGTGTYNYLWAYVSGDSAITINSSISTLAQWSGHVNGAIPTRAAVWSLTATDTSGNMGSTTLNVSVNYNNPH